MILGCVGVKRKWPGREVLSRQQLIEGRVYSVMGYDSRLPQFWKRLNLGLPLCGRKIYVFGESIP
jgi:hypothetical protein